MNLSQPFRCLLVATTPDETSGRYIDLRAMSAIVDYAGGKHPRWQAYLSTRDEAHLALVPGALAPWFRLRAIKARELNRLVSNTRAPTGDELWTIAQRCLECIDNVEGLSLTDTEFVTLGSIGSSRCLTEDAMERIAAVIGIEGVRELGGAVLTRAQPASAFAPFASPPG